MKQAWLLRLLLYCCHDCLQVYIVINKIKTIMITMIMIHQVDLKVVQYFAKEFQIIIVVVTRCMFQVKYYMFRL